MASKKKRLSGTVVPVVLSVTVAVASQGMAATSGTGDSPSEPQGATEGGTLQLAACNPCNPCGACNPCAAGCNPCNPCGACNPCNPCAAGGGASSDCDVPRLASACNPCNPCGGCNPCNPCAAACNPCNPCAAACNPCSPCGGCNPCGAGGGAPELSAAEAKAAYACIQASLKAGYAKSGNEWAAAYSGWTAYNTQPYISDTHGGRYVNNYANGRGANYGEFENAGPAPEGTVLAKDSFSVKANGKVGPGPLFLMEKMTAGFSADTQDWRYTLLLPNGKVIGTTGGEGSDKVGFCAECHLGVEEQDSRFFLPEDYRVQ